MISDTLFDAIEAIRDYQVRMPECYDDLRDEIDSVVSVMQALLVKLDLPPGSDEIAHRKYAAALNKFFAGRRFETPLAFLLARLTLLPRRK